MQQFNKSDRRLDKPVRQYSACALNFLNKLSLSQSSQTTLQFGYHLWWTVAGPHPDWPRLPRSSYLSFTLM